MDRQTIASVRSELFSAAKRLVRRAGLEVKRRRNELDEDNVLAQFFAEHAIDLVLDVGANAGQYRDVIRAAGYGGDILSFEPLPTAYEDLVAASRGDARWTVAPRAALGAEDSERVALHVANNSASSSLLPMLDAHTTAAPESRYIDTIDVPLMRLDTAVGAGMREKAAAFLKIDAQGYEDRILAGASGVVGQIKAVQVEMSLVPLYHGQASTRALFDSLHEWGFRLAFIIPGFRQPRSGRLLQFDGIFVRDGEARPEAVHRPRADQGRGDVQRLSGQ